MTYLILAFLAYIIPLSYIVYRTHWVKTADEFDVAERRLPTTLVFASVAATFLGPGYSMGFIGKGFAGGTIWWLMGIVYAIQTVIIGVLIAPRMRDIPNARTLGGVYGSKTGALSQFVVGMLSVGLCAGFAAVMLAAGGKLFVSFFGWPVWVGVIFTAILTTAYTVTGGLRASVATDAFQFAIFAILIPALLVVLMVQGRIDVTAIGQSGSDLSAEFVRSTGKWGIFALMLSFLVGETMIPPYASRALGAKNRQNARRGFLIAGIFAVIWFLCVVVLGLAARQIIDKNSDGDVVLLNLLQTFPGFMQSFVGIALLGVIMSSLDSLLNSGGVAFSEDVVAIGRQKWNAGAVTEKTMLVLSRVGIVVISAVGCIGALRVQGIVDGLLKCYAMWGPAIIPSLFYVLLVKRPSSSAAIASIVTGILVPLGMQLGIFAKDFDPILIGMACSVTVLLAAIEPPFGLRHYMKNRK